MVSYHPRTDGSRSKAIRSQARQEKPRRISELLMSPQCFADAEEDGLTRFGVGDVLHCGAGASACPAGACAGIAQAKACATRSPKPGSAQIPRPQEFGVSTRRLCALWRHARVPAPHSPARECELILAWVLTRGDAQPSRDRRERSSPYPERAEADQAGMFFFLNSPMTALPRSI